MRKLKKIISAVTAMAAMAAFALPFTASAAPQTGSITFNLPADVMGAPQAQNGIMPIAALPTDGENGAVTSMSISAYQVLEKRVSPESGYGITEGFTDFFDESITGWTNASYVSNDAYLVYDSANHKMKVQAEAPVSGKYIQIDKSEASIMDSNSIAAAIFEDIVTGETAQNKDNIVLTAWLKDYIAYKDSALTAVTTANPEYTAGAWKVSLTGLTAGYYVTTASNVAANIANVEMVLFLAEGESATVNVKAEWTEISKKVKGGTTTTYGDAAYASIGDTLDYQVELEVPNLSNYDQDDVDYTFTFSDTLSNQALKSMGTGSTNEQGYFKVIIGVATYSDLTDGDYTDLSSIATVAPGSYAGGKQSFTLTFKVAELKKLAEFQKVGGKMTIQYQAALTKDAVLVNSNEAKLVYTNDPTGTTSTAEVTDKTDVITYGIDVQKEFSDKSTTYTDVEFTLYKATSGSDGDYTAGTAIPVVKGASNGVYTVDMTKSDTTMTLSEAGKLNVYGLADGLYLLKETKIPSGYKSAGDMLITITKGKVTAAYAMTGSVQRDDNADNKYDKSIDSSVSDSNNKSTLVFSYLNQKDVFDLPTTGGAGIWAMVIGGMMLLALGFVFLKKNSGAAAK